MHEVQNTFITVTINVNWLGTWGGEGEGEDGYGY